jgi:tryptophan synthase alpha chain
VTAAEIDSRKADGGATPASPAAASPGRIADAFARAREEGRTAVIPFVTAGYPTLERSQDWALAMVRGGADLLEIGIPFSDPLADGATVQRTSQTALRQGVTLADAIAIARRLRQRHGVTVPILFMGYVNPMLQYGLERLAADAAAAGVDGFIVPDLPAEESDELLDVCRRHGLDLVFLLAPTSTDERIAAVAQRASGFIYCVSLTGVTGQRDALPDFASYLTRVRARTDLPVAIGFGVSTPEHVRQIGEVADGAVIASALINYLDTVPDADQVMAAEQFVRGLRGEAAFPPEGSAPAAANKATATAAEHRGGNVEPAPAQSESELYRPRACRGIRGATTVESSTAEDLLEATTELLDLLIRLNDLRPEDVVSAIFTTTPELTAAFPAMAARELGWTEVPLLCAHEMNVPGALQGVVRILLHVNTPRGAAEIRHVYLREARALRPEWAYGDDQIAAIRERHPEVTESDESPARPAAPHHRSGGNR